MPVDVYGPCPCGSGKKLKFCCQPIVGEIEKIERLQESNQLRVALQTLDLLEKKHPGNAWIATTKAEILLEEGEPDAATETLESLVREQPDHTYGIGLLAVASFAADGFELAKPAIHRAFQRCVRDFPALVSELAMAVAASMMGGGKYLAARAHLALALTIAPEEHKRDVFLRLLEFDGNRRIPWPLRSVHAFHPLQGLQAQGDEVRKAMLLAGLGCWRPAARLLARLGEQHGEHADLWFNIGLCRAWDGDETLAAEALHTAARLQEDFETAVEWETLAQLLDFNTTDDRVLLVGREYDVSSVSRLLTKLDEEPRLTRVAIPPEEEEDGPAAIFYIVDDPERLQSDPATYTRETVPAIRGQVTVYDRSDEPDEDEEEAEPRVFLSGTEGAEFDAAAQVFEDAAGDLVERDEEEEDEPTATVPRELSELMWRWHFPEKTPLCVRRRLELQQWEHVTQRVWPESPLSALGGKTPADAAGDPGLNVPLRAALTVLDAYCDRSRYRLDAGRLRERLGIDAPQPVQFEGEAALNSLTAMQLLRVPVREISDESLAMLVHRAVLIHHAGFVEDVLSELANRPDCLARFDAQKVFLILEDLCREEGRYEDSLRWIERGKEYAAGQERSFELTLQWVMRELTLRVEDPSDPALGPLLQHINDYYLPKLPELRPTVSTLVAAFDIPAPWEASGEPSVAGSGPVTTGLWTPGGEQPAAADATRKLWLPGQ